jgi:CRISPR system Cascade subunit CasE
MYFTVIPLNVSRQETQKILSSPQVAHAAVLDSFPPTVTDSERGRVLWRIDRGARHEVTLVIVSPDKPSPLHLVENAGWNNGHEGYTSHDYQRVLDKIAAGDSFSFRVVANTTKCVQKKRVGLYTEADQLQWITDRAEDLGFTMKTVRVTKVEPDSFSRDGKNLKFAKAQYDGVLEVTNQEKFLAALTNGIGRAKGYGNGLLTIARAG